MLGLAMLLMAALAGEIRAQGSEPLRLKENKTGLYRDVFDQNIFYEGTSYLHLDRLYQRLFHKKVRAKNVNVFDEVPDSAFFTNRHARQRLSREELRRGYREGTAGPDLSRKLTIINGKFQQMQPEFYVRDSRGEEYLLRFDTIDFFELATSSEVIASRFYYAFGYNVPQNTLITLTGEQLVVPPEAKIVDDSGFKRALTQEKLEEYLLFLPQTEDGLYRASALKLPSGVGRGHFSFQGHRSHDPEDPFDHKDRREVRALQVFSSWLNHFYLEESKTLSVLQTREDGTSRLKHYFIDFSAALGAGDRGAKAPMMTHEYMMDYGEAMKAFFTLGWWEKPWQKRWREVKENPYPSPAIGYFDNRYFNPASYKTRLPYYAFKDVTRADGFWAAKIIMAFTQEEIAAMIEAGQLSRAEDRHYLLKTLVERQKMIGRYWFEKANPLDAFDLKKRRLIFKDLAVTYGFYPADGTLYHIDLIRSLNGRRQKVASFQVDQPSVDLSEWLGDDTVELWIRTARPGGQDLSPYVLVKVNAKGIQGIIHED